MIKLNCCLALCMILIIGLNCLDAAQLHWLCRALRESSIMGFYHFLV